MVMAGTAWIRWATITTAIMAWIRCTQTLWAIMATTAGTTRSIASIRPWTLVVTRAVIMAVVPVVATAVMAVAMDMVVGINLPA